MLDSQTYVASAQHLITLKIHAMKTFQEQRDAKDFSDLLFLIKKTNIGLPELQALCKRYASIEIFVRLKGALSHA